MSDIDAHLTKMNADLEQALAYLEQAKADINSLVTKAKVLVEMLDEREKYHGSLIGPETLMLVNDLRLEVARWKK